MKKKETFDLGSMTVSELLGGLAAKKPAPGGGAAAAAVGALGAALGGMVIAFSEGKEEFADLLDMLRKNARALDEQRRDFMALCDRDAEAFAELSRLVKRRQEDPERMQKEGTRCVR